MQARIERPVTVTAPDEPLGLWASYRAMRRNVLEIVPKGAYRERALAGGLGRGWVMLSDPDAIERVLKTESARFPRSALARRLLSPRRGDNVVSAEGEAWRAHRRALSPMFQPRALPAYGGAMTAAAEAASARIAAADGAVDVFPVMMEATRDVICDLALSGREALDRDAFARLVDRGLASANRVSLLDVLRVPNWVPRPHDLLDDSRARLDRMADAVIAARRARGPSDPPDLLDRVIAAADADGGATLGPVEVRNDLLALLFAGHETTALALSWALYLLSLDEASQARAAEVARGAIGERAATAADLPRLGYVRQVLEEALRLYPPAALLARMATVSGELAGIPVRPGTTVLIPVYALHRHADFWDDPDAFDPDRFAPEAARGRPRFAFLPFGGGPRVCLGADFALGEAQVILATLLARHRFAPVPGARPRPLMRFTLRPAEGVRLAARPRT